MTVSTSNVAAPRTIPVSPQRVEPGIRLWVSLEVLIYVLLAVLAITLRLSELDRAPLNDVEARQALSALRTVNGDVAGDPVIAESPLTFAFNAVTFAFMPTGNEFAARLPVALAGVLLTLAPALWRRFLNPLPPLIASFLLTMSPVALLASRTMSPVVWSMLLAIVAPWLVLRYVETRRESWAVAATAAFAALIFLAEPAGFLALLALAFGVGFAWFTAVDEAEATGSAIRDLWRAWPWANGGMIAGVIVVAVGTLLLWVPAGLTVIGTVLADGLEGFISRPVDTPIAFPLWISLRYEFGIVLFGFIACLAAVRDGGFFERTLVGWALAGAFLSIAYAGAGAAHALWITVPLSILVALQLTNWLTERAHAFWNVPPWAISVHTVITLALWLVIGISLVILAKLLLYDLPGGVTKLSALMDALGHLGYSRSANFEAGQVKSIDVQDGVLVFDYVLANIQWRLVIMFIVAVLNGVLFMLWASIWGMRVAWRGFALGTLAALWLFSAGLGGRASFSEPGDPREYWYTDAVTTDIYELRTTLHEMSLRDTGETNLIAITAQVPDDGALAWALRDFTHVTFVNGVGPEVSSAAVLVPQGASHTAMGADYLGKDLITRRAWDIETVSWKDVLMWVYRNDSNWKPVTSEQLMLWIRKDVYGVEQVIE